MQSAQEKNIIVVKLEDGENLLPSLERIVEKYSIESGVFLGGVGMIREFEIGYWGGKEYLTEFHETPHELLHYGGSIACVEGKPMFHIHATLAGPDHRTIGGHVNRQWWQCSTRSSFSSWRRSSSPDGSIRIPGSGNFT